MNIQKNRYKTFTKEGKKEVTISSLNDKLDLLDKRIDEVGKIFEYYDIVKISQSVQDVSEFGYKFSKLLPFEAMIINCNSFLYESKTYSRGDLVLKLIDKQLHIRASTAGFYYPSHIVKPDKSSEYELTYSYTNENVSTGEGTIGVNKDSLAKPQETIKVTGIMPTEQQTIYGHVFVKPDPEPADPWNSPAFTFITKDKKIIKPFIKGFTSSSEECYWEIELEIVGDTCTIKNIPKVIKTVVVK